MGDMTPLSPKVLILCFVNNIRVCPKVTLIVHCLFYFIFLREFPNSHIWCYSIVNQIRENGSGFSETIICFSISKIKTLQ